jgi:hypothetical protein
MKFIFIGKLVRPERFELPTFWFVVRWFPHDFPHETCSFAALLREVLVWGDYVLSSKNLRPRRFYRSSLHTLSFC